MAGPDAQSSPLRAPKGTRDLLPPESERLAEVVDLFAAHARRAGFGFALTPIFEDSGVFARGVGASTDIVRKEMYVFEDRDARSMALRPEATASIARAYVQQRPSQLPWKLWYWGPMFRYEQPQAGRFRQFYQLGAEVLGTDDPECDLEVIAFLWDYLVAAGAGTLQLKVNSLGDDRCRPAFREMLRRYLTDRRSSLCPEHRDRYEENPMRILDCKREACREATAEAPRQIDLLCPECRDAFGVVTGGLEAMSIPHRVDPRLVRGLDYYDRTTFEFAVTDLAAAQNAVGGGGRYDGLVEMLGGPPTPAVGFSVGIDRLLLAVAGAGASQHPCVRTDAYIVTWEMAAESAGAGPAARGATLLARDLRAAGLTVERDFGARSPKAQFRAADKSGASVALIVGPEEAARDEVAIKYLRDRARPQESVARRDIVEEVRKRLP